MQETFEDDQIVAKLPRISMMSKQVDLETGMTRAVVDWNGYRNEVITTPIPKHWGDVQGGVSETHVLAMIFWNGSSIVYPLQTDGFLSAEYVEEKFAEILPYVPERGPVWVQHVVALTELLRFALDK